MVAADNHQSRQLAVSTGAGIEREVAQARNLREHPLKHVLRLKRALHGILGL